MVIHFGELTKMNSKSLLAFLGAMTCVVGLGACVGPTDTSFPDRQLATTPDGAFPNVDNLRMIEPGMTKQQVYQLIGPPHFHESVFHVRVWNYLFHFRAQEKTLSCQYQIQYDDRNRVSQTRWNDSRCDTFAPAKIAADAQAASTTEKTQ